MVIQYSHGLMMKAVRRFEHRVDGLDRESGGALTRNDIRVWLAVPRHRLDG